MKNVLKIVAILVLGFVGYAIYILINPVSPKDTVVYNSDDANFEVVYSRPYKKRQANFRLGGRWGFGSIWKILENWC